MEKNGKSKACLGKFKKRPPSTESGRFSSGHYLGKLATSWQAWGKPMSCFPLPLSCRYNPFQAQGS